MIYLPTKGGSGQITCWLSAMLQALSMLLLLSTLQTKTARCQVQQKCCWKMMIMRASDHMKKSQFTSYLPFIHLVNNILLKFQERCLFNDRARSADGEVIDKNHLPYYYSLWGCKLNAEFSVLIFHLEIDLILYWQWRRGTRL